MEGKKLQMQYVEKVASTESGGEIEIWGDGLQTRSFFMWMNV